MLNLAYAGACCGILLIYVELLRPGIVLPGVAGLAILIAALRAFLSGDVGLAPASLIVAAATCLLAELFCDTRWTAPLASACCLALASYALVVGPAHLHPAVVSVAGLIALASSTCLARIARIARQDKRRELLGN